jgi:cellulose biosynthesis protein BcsQ
MRKTLKFLTWLDVDRVIRRETFNGRKLPETISRIECFSSALEISLLNSSAEGEAKGLLKELFKDWYLEDINVIQLDLGDALLPVEFIQTTSKSPPKQPYPFWSDISYLPTASSEGIDEFTALPTSFDKAPNIIAFYSFKGGVGRTLHLAAHCLALLEKAAELKKKIKVLVIDADLEAPGLTYWERSESKISDVSFIDFLEVYHYSPISMDISLRKFANEVQTTARQERGSTLYFLPACGDDHQLLDTPVLPEHLSRGVHGRWTCTEAIYELGKTLEIDYIFIDLRAGLSEISSPILLDPRVQRILVTPASEQSISGMSLVLEQISRIAPSDTEIRDEKYSDPSIVMSLLTKEIKELPIFDVYQERLLNSYQQTDREPLESRNLDIQTSDFAQELMHINSWNEAESKLQGTSVMRLAQKWASSQFSDDLSDEKTNDGETGGLERVRRLRDICEEYEFAESGKGKELLITNPIMNLAQSFVNSLPNAISIGAKGAGKTFTYLQIARFQYWENFLAKVLGTDYPNPQSSVNVFPFLEPKHMEDDAKKIVKGARDESFLKMGGTCSFSYTACIDRISEHLNDPSFTTIQWSKFWIREIGTAIGLEAQYQEEFSLEYIHKSLQERGLKFVFLIDGLEDVFSEVSSNRQHQWALYELLDIPRRLSDIRQSCLGIIILVRRDFLRYLFPQNLQQFENLYKPYDLHWDEESFLRLVLWICIQARIIDSEKDDIDQMGYELIKKRLESLWGRKLGADKSNEAYTSNWIFAALCDFKGRLQARDIVRILQHAANRTVNSPQEVQFKRWSSSRILPPQAIRDALEPCSKSKVAETGQEYPQFRKWIEGIHAKLPIQNRHIPFYANEMDIDQREIQMLEDIGAIYGDVDKKDGTTRFYMPEIFRAGLGFTLKKGARPRILVLQKKILSNR